jgi:hypothetical protein
VIDEKPKFLLYINDNQFYGCIDTLMDGWLDG